MFIKTRIEAERAKKFLRQHRHGCTKCTIAFNVGSGAVATIYLRQSGAVRLEVPSGILGLQAAVETWLENIDRPVECGAVFHGIVTTIYPFGVFVQLTPDKQGFLHISRIPGCDCSSLSLGQLISVTVSDVDELGQVNVTMQQG